MSCPSRRGTSGASKSNGRKSIHSEHRNHVPCAVGMTYRPARSAYEAGTRAPAADAQRAKIRSAPIDSAVGGSSTSSLTA